MRRLLNSDYYRSILIEVPDLARMEQAEKEITSLLRVRHRISEFRPADFQVQSQRELIDTQMAAADRLQFLVRWIGFSALIVAGLGILSIAWVAVRDRTNEIGTRRALGARLPMFSFNLHSKRRCWLPSGSPRVSRWGGGAPDLSPKVQD